MKTFAAPWSRSLKITSLVSALLCLTFGLGLPFLPWLRHPAVAWTGWLVLALVPVCPLFIVRGYAITPDAILVRRPCWSTRLPRTGLVSATSTPNAMTHSLRTCGNGGFFSHTGWYWSQSLGSHRAFVTDPAQTVVLRYADRTIIVSPDDPEAFAHALQP